MKRWWPERRWRRRLYPLLALGVILWLCVRSFQVEEFVALPGPVLPESWAEYNGVDWAAGSGAGRWKVWVGCYRAKYRVKPRHGQKCEYWERPADAYERMMVGKGPRGRWMGLWWGRSAHQVALSGGYVWPMGICGLWLALAWWRTGRKVGKEAHRKCACGYDLRAHKVGEKCPECGRVVVEAAEGDGTPDGDARRVDGVRSSAIYNHPMVRHVFAFFVLFFFVASATIWIGSYRRTVMISYGTLDFRILLAALNGRFRIAWYSLPGHFDVVMRGPTPGSSPPRIGLGKRPWGIGLHGDPLGGAFDGRGDYQWDTMLYREGTSIYDTTWTTTDTPYPGGFIIKDTYVEGMGDETDAPCVYPCRSIEGPMMWVTVVLALPALLGIWHVVGYVRRRFFQRRNSERCADCGYDLRGHVEGAGGGRCPECGRAIGGGERAGGKHEVSV